MESEVLNDNQKAVIMEKLSVSKMSLIIFLLAKHWSRDYSASIALRESIGSGDCFRYFMSDLSAGRNINLIFLSIPNITLESLLIALSLNSLVYRFQVVDKCLCDGADEYLQIMAAAAVIMEQFNKQ